MKNLGLKAPTFKQAWKKLVEPWAVDGKFCSNCGTEVDVEFDDGWDCDENGCSFRADPYLYCSTCKRRVRPYYD